MESITNLNEQLVSNKSKKTDLDNKEIEIEIVNSKPKMAQKQKGV